MSARRIVIQAVSFAALLAFGSLIALAAEVPAAVQQVFNKRCHGCHSSDTKSGGLDLTALKSDFGNVEAFSLWVKIHDRMESGEMPPKSEPRLSADEKRAVTEWLRQTLVAAEAERFAASGRTAVRRLTRVEYENTVRDLFDLPGLPLLPLLPPDGTVNGFDRNAEALSISHVNLAKYIEAADHVLDHAIATRPTAPAVQKVRTSLLDRGGQAAYLSMQGDVVLLHEMKADPAYPPAGEFRHIDQGAHEQAGSFETDSSVGIFRREDESVNYYFRGHTTVFPGRYRVRTSLWAFQWDQGQVLPARGTEALRLAAVQLTADGRGGQHPNYTLGYYDAPSLKPAEHELEVWLNMNEILGCDVASLAPVANYSRKGHAMAFTGPAITVDWLDVEGPLNDVWPPRSHQQIFGSLPLGEFKAAEHPGVRGPVRKPVRWLGLGKNKPEPVSGIWTVTSDNPRQDAERLLARFLPKAFRRPVAVAVRQRYVDLFAQYLESGDCFETAMRQTIRTALCSPDFLYHLEPQDGFDDHALACRLSYMLWNTLPDDELTRLAARGELHHKDVLRAQVQRLLSDRRAQRFVDDFAGQWLKLRSIAANDPDRKLYPEFSPYLQESMVAETRAYVRALLEKDLDIGHLVHSDFAMLNEKLASHYDIDGVSGSSIRRVTLPPECPRGGLLTQGSILKLTANGTTTSPVPRGAFVMDRILGQPPEPPPTSVPAVEPDVRGAVTIREQLDKHRSDATCAACHAKIDPPGFALESFDVIGRFRTRYRSLENGDPAPRGNIDPFIGISFKLGPAVDASGSLPDGRAFRGIRELQSYLASDRQVLLRNLARQFLIYGTCRDIAFSDRDAVAAIMTRIEEQGGGVRTLLREVILSSLFNEVKDGRKSEVEPDVSALVTSDTTSRNPDGVSEAQPSINESAVAAPVAGQTISVQFSIAGLFQPDRVDDLKRQAGVMRMGEQDMPTEVKVVDVDYAAAAVTFAYDPESKHFKGAKETQVRERIDNLLRHTTRGAFSVLPPSDIPSDKLHVEKIRVAGLDCKGCSFGAYRAVTSVPGVVRATASFKDGWVIAWIDPSKTNRDELLSALERRQVTIIKPDSAEAK